MSEYLKKVQNRGHETKLHVQEFIYYPEQTHQCQNDTLIGPFPVPAQVGGRLWDAAGAGGKGPRGGTLGGAGPGWGRLIIEWGDGEGGGVHSLLSHPLEVF